MSKEIKSKKYQGVYFRELDNGDRSYFVRVRLGGGTKRIPIGKKSEGITEAFCFQEKIRIVNAHRFGEDVARELQKVKKEEPTFAELIDFYVENKQPAPSTVRNLLSLKRFDFAKSRRLTTEELQRNIDKDKGRLRPATLNQRIKMIRLVIRYAIKKGKYKHKDPTDAVDLIKAETARRRYLSAHEVQLLLNAVKDKPRLYLFVKAALCTGARISTLMKIHQRDISPDGSVRLYNTKAARFYTGFFDEETMALVNGREGFIFARRDNPNKEPGVHLIQRYLKEILDELFNPPGTAIEDRVVVHTLRHSVATQQIKKGVPMEVIARTLDHADITVTARVYAKVAPELVQKATHGLWD